MQRRITILLPGTLLLALVSLAVISHYGAKGRLEAYRLQLKASGEKSTIDELRPVLSPQEIDAGQDLLAAAGLILSPGGGAPIMKPLPPGRALAACRETVLPTEDSTNIWPSLEALRDRNASALVQVRAVLSRPGFAFEIDYARDAILVSPYLARMKSLALSLSLAATVELHEGELTNAWEDLDALARLVSGYNKDCLLVSVLVRVAIAGAAIAPTWEALQCSGWTDEQLLSLQCGWESVDFLSQAESALTMEGLLSPRSFAACRKSYNAINSLPGSAVSGLSELSEIGEEVLRNPGRGFKTALHRYPGYWGWKYWQSYEDELVSAKAIQAALAAVRHAKSSGVAGATLTEFDDIAPAIRKEHPSAGKWVGASMVDNKRAFLARIASIEMQRSLLVTAIALKRYELKHGNYPAELRALCPNFIAQIPRDPIDGKPMRYRPEGDGTFVLYSIGENGEDDGGNPEPSLEAHQQWWRARDAVWPRAASPEQVQDLFRVVIAKRQRSANPTASGNAGLIEQFRRRYGLPMVATNPPRGATN